MIDTNALRPEAELLAAWIAAGDAPGQRLLRLYQTNMDPSELARIMLEAIDAMMEKPELWDRFEHAGLSAGVARILGNGRDDDTRRTLLFLEVVDVLQAARVDLTDPESAAVLSTLEAEKARQRRQ